MFNFTDFQEAAENAVFHYKLCILDWKFIQPRVCNDRTLKIKCITDLVRNPLKRSFVFCGIKSPLLSGDGVCIYS